MTSPTIRRRRRGQHESRTPRTPASVPEPERGATLNLQDPKSFIQWLTSNADGFLENARNNRDNARTLWATAAEHDRNEQAAAAKIDELQKQIDALAAQRDTERQKKEMRAAEAKQLDDHAQNSENAAADIQASIPVIQQAAAANGNGLSPVTAPIALDPQETARIDRSLAAIDAAHAELPADQRDVDEL